MINIILAYDDIDKGDEENSGLDFFFIACAHQAAKIFNPSDNILHVNGDNLNMKYINKTILEINNSKFLFVAYSHGLDDSLLCNNQNNAYVAANKNTHLFNNSLFYTWSCSCGKELGPDLIRKGCYTFIGYDDYIMAGTGEMEHFIRCANYGIKMLIAGKNTGDAFDNMIKEYTKTIDYFDEICDTMLASFFRRNRDALMIDGDREITLNDINT